MGIVMMCDFKLEPKTRYVLNKIKGKRYKDEIGYVVDLRAIEDFIERGAKSFVEWLGFSSLMWTYEEEFDRICKEMGRNPKNYKPQSMTPIIKNAVKFHKKHRGTAATYLSRNIFTRWKEKRKWKELGGII